MCVLPQTMSSAVQARGGAMRKVVSVSTLLGALLFSMATTVAAQEKDPLIEPVVRKDILPCDVKYFAKFADEKEYPGYWVWTPDHAGVNPVNRTVRGIKPHRLSEYFRGVEPGKKYSDSERVLLARSRIANEASLAALVYTPPGTPVTEIPPTLPNDDYEKLVLPTTDEFEEIVIPCGAVLERGTTSSSRGPDSKIGIIPTKAHMIVGWYERGVKTPDGTPGIRAFMSKRTWTPSVGPSAGVPHKVGVIANCGNPYVEPVPVQEVVEVPAPALVEEPRPRLVIPPPTPEQLNPPRPQPFPTPSVTSKNGHNWPCTGKYSRLICPAVGAAIAAAIWRPWDKVRGPEQSSKTGSPGTR